MWLSRWMLSEKLRGLPWPSIGVRIWGVLVLVAVMALFVYQNSLNLQVYQSVPTVLTVSMEPNPTFRLPPVSVCPHPPYDPTKLRSLGLNVSGHYINFEESYFSLRGIPDELVSSQLWQKAAWDFNDAVLYLETDQDQGKGKIFQASDPMPSSWQESLSPLGPCFTYSPPVGQTGVLIKFWDAPQVELCTYPNDDGEFVKYKGVEAQCAKVKKYCNSSCGIEDYIYFNMLSIDRVFLYFHETPVYNDQLSENDDIYSYSKKLFDGNYILYAATESPDVNIEAQFIETSLLKGSCNSNPTYTHGQCYQKLHEAEVESLFGCSPLYSSVFHQPSGQVCRSPNDFDKLYRMELLTRFHCQQKCKRKKFSLDKKLAYEFSHTMRMFAITTDIKREIEVETYPLSRLFSDVGGSLGLFLGVSVVTFLDLVISSVTRFCDLQDKAWKHHMITMVRYCAMLLLALGTGAHSLETLRSYLLQPRLTAVTLRATTPEPTTEAVLVTRRLAARALGCRPQESKTEECLARCLLELATNDIASVSPFTTLEDLPLCQKMGLSLPSLAYVIPPEMLMVAIQDKIVNTCKSVCKPVTQNNNTQEKGFVMTINHDHYNFDTLQLVCSIGGIIGLYLGYSLFDGLEFSDSIVSKQTSFVWIKTLNITSKTVHLTLKLGVVAICIILALWQLHTFLMYHKISSSTQNVQRDNRTEKLAIIVCRWPPLSLSHVASQLNINISTRLLYKLPKKERLPEVLRVLDTLPGNWSVILDDIWQHAAWNITDVVEAFMALSSDGKYNTLFCGSNSLCAELWQPIMTPLNRCFSFKASLLGKDVTELTIVFPQVVEKKSILGNSPQVYFAITPVNEQPLLSDMIAKTAYRRILATVHQAKYHRLGSNTKSNALDSYRSCVNKCLSDIVSYTHKCGLPFMPRQSNLSSCNQDEYTEVPRFFKGLEGIGQAWSELRYSQGVSKLLVTQREECYKKCHHLQGVFTAVSVEKVFDSFPTVVVRLQQEEDVVVIEEDLHTFSQLFSDMGGIAGSTVGLSLLFLLKDLLPPFIIHQNA